MPVSIAVHKSYKVNGKTDLKRYMKNLRIKTVKLFAKHFSLEEQVLPLLITEKIIKFSNSNMCWNST